MTNISKNPLSADELERLFFQLNTTIATLNKQGAHDFLHDLLGTEERIMLAKRFAIIVMITENYSTYSIAKKLKVSTSTVDAIRTRHEHGTYDQLLKHICANKKTYRSLWETLDQVLHVGGVLPHYVGLDRYRGLR
jgi:uncharacterized protein YerC